MGNQISENENSMGKGKSDNPSSIKFNKNFEWKFGTSWSFRFNGKSAQVQKRQEYHGPKSW